MLPAQCGLLLNRVQSTPEIRVHKLHNHVELLLPQPGPQHEHHSWVAAVVQDGHLAPCRELVRQAYRSRTCDGVASLDGQGMAGSACLAVLLD